LLWEFILFGFFLLLTLGKRGSGGHEMERRVAQRASDWVCDLHEEMFGTVENGWVRCGSRGEESRGRRLHQRLILRILLLPESDEIHSGHSSLGIHIR